jgi:DNA-binding NtrC family response regulator
MLGARVVCKSKTGALAGAAWLGAWHVLGATELASRSEALPVGELTPLIGRDDELQLLHRRWELAKSGELQIVLVSGEAGIGKSRLLAALQERLKDEPHASCAITARHIDRTAHWIRSSLAGSNKLDFHGATAPRRGWSSWRQSLPMRTSAPKT